jgi:hypothetical protein
MVDAGKLMSQKVSPDANTDGILATKAVPQNEVWYIDYGCFLTTVSGSSISYNQFEIAVEIGTGANPEKDASGLFSSSFEAGNLVSAPLGNRYALFSGDGNVSDINERLYPGEAILIWEVKDYTASSGELEVQVYGRKETY